jgi:membrane protease YdiL (CAAX protease family)
MYERTIFFEWLAFAIVVAGVRLAGSPLSAVLGERWRSPLHVLRDIGIAMLFWAVSTLALSIIAVHPHNAGPDRAVLFLMPQSSTEMLLWSALAVSAGICEETVYRGYLQRQFGALTQSASAGIVLAAIAFGAAHAYKGLWGAVRAGMLGAMLGALAQWRRSVRPGMISHAWTDFFAGVLARALKIPVG